MITAFASNAVVCNFKVLRAHNDDFLKTVFTAFLHGAEHERFNVEKKTESLVLEKGT